MQVISCAFRILFTGLVTFWFVEGQSSKPANGPPADPVAAYQGLVSPWKERAIAAWKAECVRTRKNLRRNLRVLRNQPPYFPFVFLHGSDGNAVLKSDRWGVVGEGVPGVDVLRVVHHRKAICELDREVFIIDDVDMSNVQEGRMHIFKELCFVDGTEPYLAADGSTRPIFVLRPVPKTK